MVIEGYHRRRAWSAFHAGYGQNKGARLEHLLGKDTRQRATPEQMLARFDRHVARHRSLTAND
jgi:hypothetical protein